MVQFDYDDRILVRKQVRYLPTRVLCYALYSSSMGYQVVVTGAADRSQREHLVRTPSAYRPTHTGTDLAYRVYTRGPANRAYLLECF